MVNLEEQINLNLLQQNDQFLLLLNISKIRIYKSIR
jgi:hypothetical protein